MLNSDPTLKHSLFFLAALIILFFISSQSVSAAGNSQMGKELLLDNTVKLGASDIRTKMLRVTFPAGFKTPWHTHRGPGPRYVIKGSLKITEQGKSTIYNTGEVFWESGQLMSAENVGSGEAQVVIFELTP